MPPDIPAAKLRPVRPSTTTTPPVMYSQQWSPAPSITAMAPELRTAKRSPARSEEHTSELQSLTNLVCRLLLEKKNRIPSPQKRLLRGSWFSRRRSGRPAPPLPHGFLRPLRDTLASQLP